MKLRRAIKQADRICVSVYMNVGTSYSVKISKKDALVVAKDHLDQEFEDDVIKNEEGRFGFTIASKWFRKSRSVLFLGRS